MSSFVNTDAKCSLRTSSSSSNFLYKFRPLKKVVPQSDGSSSKVKVKVRVNIHGIFSISSASLVEVQKCEETDDIPMETDQQSQANLKEEESKMQIDQQEEPAHGDGNLPPGSAEGQKNEIDEME
eukprot:g43785.t1